MPETETLTKGTLRYSQEAGWEQYFGQICGEDAWIACSPPEHDREKFLRAANRQATPEERQETQRRIDELLASGRVQYYRGAPDDKAPGDLP